MLGKNEEKGKGNKKSCVSQTSAAIKKGRLKMSAFVSSEKLDDYL